MKKFITFIAPICLWACIVNAQDRQQINNLTALAKVWGFLKYYHPDLAKGNPDCDKELVKIIPLVKAAKSDAEFNKLISDWYNLLPKVELAPAVTQIKSDTIVRIFDENDIKHFGAAKPLTDELTKLYLYHLPDSSKLITDHYKQYHLDYISHNEDQYPGMAFPNEAYRLLALFRYWNVINYFYPYKNVNAKNWDNVLPEFIPRVIACRDSDEYRQTFLMLTARLKDSHSFFVQQQWNNTHPVMKLPFELCWIDDKYYIGKSSRKALMEQMGFKIGDEITGINNQPVAMREKQLRLITTGTNEPSWHRNIAYNMFSIDTSRTMQLTVNRQGTTISKTVHLFTGKELAKLPADPQPKLWENLGKGVWLVRFCKVTKPDTLKKLFTDLQQAKAVIWDMRDYPSFPVTQVVGRGLYAQKMSSTISYNGILAFPGTLTKRMDAPAYGQNDTLKLQVYKGRMIVLVNEQTQSLSESVAYELSLRPNTIVMGSQTAGTTGNITWIGLPGGIEASFTAVGVEGLKGSFSEGKGVKIDKEIKVTPAMLAKSADIMIEIAYQEALK